MKNLLFAVWKNSSRPKIGQFELIIYLAAITGIANFCCAADLSDDINGLRVFDTVTSIDKPFSSPQIKNKQGWRQIADEPSTITVRGEDITGDLCVENSKMTVILRRNSVGPEVYYKIGEHFIKAVTLCPAAADETAAIDIESFKIISGDETHILLSCLSRTESGRSVSLQYLIRQGQATIEIHPGEGAHKIFIQHESSYAIVPDLFADDLVIHPQKVKGDKLYLPADSHLLLQMIDNGDAIIVCNWPSSDGEIAVTLSDNDYKKLITKTIISFEENNKVWVSLIARKGIWHHTDISQFNIYEHSPLSWDVPFSAYWRINYRRADSKAFGFTDSFWNAETEDDGTFKLVPHLLDMNIIDGRYIITGASEQRRLVNRSVINQHTGSGWWSYRGWFIQPFYTSGNRAFAKIPKFDDYRSIRYSGPILIYPLLSVNANDSEGGTVEDVLLNTFGPEYLEVLDIADLNERCEKDHFPPTCTTTEYFEKILDRDEEVQRKDQIANILGQMNLFVKHTRERLQEYLDWEKEMQHLYQKSSRQNPKLAKVVRATKSITRYIPQGFSKNRRKIKTPQSISTLSAKIINLIDPAPLRGARVNSQSHKQIRKQMCKQICKRIRSVGGAQDELLGEYRNIAVLTRQKAGLLHTQEPDPQVRQFLRLVRSKTQKILRTRYDMEGK